MREDFVAAEMLTHKKSKAIEMFDINGFRDMVPISDKNRPLRQRSILAPIFRMNY